MKLGLLITVLISGCLSGVTINFKVHGNLTCPERFKYTVSLWEEDKNDDDYITSYTGDSNGHANFLVEGEAHDGWFESHVEPYMIVEHTCGTSVTKYTCVCHKWAPTGSTIDEAVNIDLMNTTLSYCEECEDAKIQREKDAKKFKET